LSLSCFLGDFDFRMDDGLFAPVVTVWGGAAVTGTLLPLRLPVRLPGPTLESRDCSRDRRLASVRGACSDLGFASSASSGRGFVYDVDRVDFSLAVARARVLPPAWTSCSEKMKICCGDQEEACCCLRRTV